MFDVFDIYKQISHLIIYRNFYKYYYIETYPGNIWCIKKNKKCEGIGYSN